MKIIECPWSRTWDMVICSTDEARAFYKYCALVGVIFNFTNYGKLSENFAIPGRLIIVPHWKDESDFYRLKEGYGEYPKIWVTKTDVKYYPVLKEFINLMENKDEFGKA